MSRPNTPLKPSAHFLSDGKGSHCRLAGGLAENFDDQACSELHFIGVTRCEVRYRPRLRRRNSNVDSNEEAEKFVQHLKEVGADAEIMRA